MILIQREGCDGTEGWTFDGWFLRPVRDARGALIFDGNDLVDLDPAADRRWQFDGARVTLRPDLTVLWQFENGWLFRPSAPQLARWRFDGRTLAQASDLRPEAWLATGDTPLLVIIYVAALL